MYIAAFGMVDEEQNQTDSLSMVAISDIFFNGTFLIDLGLRFCVDYYDKIKETTIRTQPELALNYLRTELFYDFIATVPFYRMINPSQSMETHYGIVLKLIYLIKIIRISKLNMLLNT